ncbi:hypothetical protein ANN_15094 [Periplaneta americana]|uniref:DUF4817 domain-containing protein n=1 Tax=Periplaneta americana TaxID=6978 RepID=A0ABQ8SY52_PERAM|nr:hypothetical protein ANN_15094 [Periplaneta americana]
MSPGSSTESYPAFAHIGLRENRGKKPQPADVRIMRLRLQFKLTDLQCNVTMKLDNPQITQIAYTIINSQQFSHYLQYSSYTEYADIVYVNGLCDGSSLRAVAEYERRFPNRRLPYRRVLTVYGVG